METWKDIPGFEGLYQVSDLGRVRSLDRFIGNRFYKGKMLRPSKNSRGYFHLRLNGKQIKVHRLVLLAFVGPSDLEGLHGDDNKSNNKLSNLRYGTRSDNMIDKTKNGKCKFTVEQVRYIRSEVQKGRKQKSLAEEFGCSFQAISEIVTKRRYATSAH